ncbi:MAG: hypothetical protein MUO61_00820 [Dehalococcoidia bacterium]|nr:hypothetical protein [Dehalococcoidia bacterium]
MCLYPTSPEDEHYDHNHQDRADGDNHPHPEWGCGSWVRISGVCCECRRSVEAQTIHWTTERTLCCCGEGAYGARAYGNATLGGGHLPVVGGVVGQRRSFGVSAGCGSHGLAVDKGAGEVSVG